MIPYTKFVLTPMSIKWVATVTIVLIVSTIAIACGNSPPSENRDTAPDFSLPVANRAFDITLSDFRDEKNVVLVFYRGFFWGICLGQLVELQSYYSRIKQQNAEIIAISMDDFQGAGTMIVNSGATFPILYTSRSDEVPSDYSVYDLHNDGVAAPAVFIINKKGNVAFEYIGKDIADRPDTNIILEELQQLGNWWSTI